MNAALVDADDRLKKALTEQQGELVAPALPTATPVLEPGGVAAPTPDAPIIGETVQAPADPAVTKLPAPPPPPAAPKRSPYSPELSDEALAKAYAAQQHANTMAQIMNAGALMNRGAGGHAPLNAGDAFRAGGDAQVQEVLGRRQAVDREFAAQHAREMAAPDSSEARFRQWLAQKAGIGEDLGERLYEVPADQLPDAGTYLKGELAAKARGARAGSGTPAETQAYLAALPAIAGRLGWTPEETEMYRQSLLAGLSDKSARAMFAGAPTGAYKQEQSNARTAAAITGAGDRQNKQIVYKEKLENTNQLEDIGKKITDTTAAVKTGLAGLLPKLQAAKQKYGEIPGTGLINDFIGKSRLASNYLNSPEEKEIRGLVESLNILNRVDVTGAAFGAQEAQDLRQAYADLLNSDNLELSLRRLAMKVDAAVKKTVGTKNPEVQAEFFKRFPEYAPTPQGQAPAAAPAARTVTNKQYSKSRNKTRLVYSDGTIEEVDGRR